MNHSLYSKFLLGYLVFGLLGFVTNATLSSRMVHRYLVEQQANLLYDEANTLANHCSSLYSGMSLDLESASSQLEIMSDFIEADIWVVDQNGSIIADSRINGLTGHTIENFNPTAIGNQSYGIGNYYGLFPYDVISVSAPITGNYTTYGYILIHKPLSTLETELNQILNIVYISGLILFALSLIILLVFTKTVYFPLRRITEGANEYASGHLEHRI